MISDYPWTQKPLIVGAPMRLLALASLAVEISAAGGLGFIGAGDNLDGLDAYLQEAADLVKKHEALNTTYQQTDILPIGFGYFNWADPEKLEKVIEAVDKWRPAAVWQFGAYENTDYAAWTERIRSVSGGKTKVWVQVGSVADAVSVAGMAKPDVLVVQGTDAGGHGLKTGAGVITLVPEVRDALEEFEIQIVAAGGIVDARGVAAAMTLGADGVCLGTRFLASEEVNITDGYRNEVVRASDGGANTLRTSLYDQLRGTIKWPPGYNARGLLNKSFRDNDAGMTLEQNKTLYDEAVKQGDTAWGVEGRMTTYAGTGVGLVKRVMKAGEIVREVRDGSVGVMERARARLN